MSSRNFITSLNGKVMRRTKIHGNQQEGLGNAWELVEEFHSQNPKMPKLVAVE